MVNQPYRKFIWSGVALIGLLVIGTLGYWFISGRQYSLIDTLYMTVITVTTIGFSEIIDLSTNPGGRIFTMFIAISGIGIVGYVATNVTVLLLEGQLTESFKRRHMENAAKSFQDHYIVCGAGNIGVHILRELLSTRRPHVIVESDQTKLQKVSGALKNEIYIEGNATENEVLLKAGIVRARGLFAVSGDDNLNLVICLTAKQLNPNLRVVAECQEVASEEKMRKVGADSIVSPSYIGGLRMASEMIRPTVTSFLDIMLRDRDKNLRVEEIKIPEKFELKTVSELGLKSYQHSLLLAARKRTDWIYNPPDTYIVEPGVTLVFMTTPEGRNMLEELFKEA
jgi:voltage-gated potassium channel